tara:strand:+ start:36 stop:455 length:420 start_codon:yes stop_codon:yes gene_type:complete
MSKASDLARLMTSGSTAVHGEAGVTASGSTGATTVLQQGLAKVWADVTGVSTAAINDSLNTSGLTDNGTGDYTIAYSNDLATGNHATVAEINFTTSGDAQNTRVVSIAAGSVRTVGTNTANASAADCRRLFQVSHGDLA